MRMAHARLTWLLLSCILYSTDGFMSPISLPASFRAGHWKPKASLLPREGLGEEFRRSRGCSLELQMADDDYELKQKDVVRELLSNSDRYKEDSRKYRRIVFTEKDWLDFRSSGRLYNNLVSMFTSGVIRGLWVEVGSVVLVATICWAMNLLVLEGQLQFLNIPSDGSFAFALPTLPFTLSSPALALLLVFRTNTVYARWNEARQAWGRIENHCINLARQGISYLEEHEREEHVRRVLALAHIAQRHFQNDVGGDEILKSRLTELLGSKETDRLMNSKGRPLQALLDITRIVRRSKSIDGSTKARFDLHLDEIHLALVTCERIRRTPVPLVYTRHTGRFLGLWILLLPFALVRELGTFILVPTCGLVAVFFFGIEELGIQIEEPFSIMPISDIVQAIDNRLRRMLVYDTSMSEDPVIGSDCAAIDANVLVHSKSAIRL